MTTCGVECKHGLVDEDCTLCNGKGREDFVADVSDGIRFLAKFDGQCKACNLPLNIGQPAVWASNRIMRNMIVIHASCADDWNAKPVRR